MSLPVVTIVGRPNVGKSTLFNRITHSRAAVVAAESGVTRDRHVRHAEWEDHHFLLVDTGGIVSHGEQTVFDSPVSAIARAAIETADALLFMVDVRSGITAEDEAIAAELRGLDRPVLLVVNKAEAGADRHEASRFYRMGLGDPAAVSALHGEGVADLLDRLVAELPPSETPAEEREDLSIALVGRPNVGKSSLLNALVGSERALVSEVAGTTRDAIDTVLRWHGRQIRLVDTAGIRRRAKHHKGVEYFSVLRTIAAVERCDVAVFLLDATEGIVAQDARVGGEIHEAGRGCLVAVNKWDLFEKDTMSARRFEEEIRRELAFLSYAPVLTISATAKQRVGRVLEMAWAIGEQRKKTVETSRLNDILAKAIARNPPKAPGRGSAKIFYGTQTAIAPPTFTLFVNRPDLFPRHYLRYLNNRVRAELGFEGTRILIDLRKRR